MSIFWKAPKGLSLVEILWMLSIVSTLAAFTWSRHQASVLISETLEVPRSLRSLVEAEQSFYFRPRPSDTGLLLSPCLLSAPLSPDASPGAKPRAWKDESGNFQALAFSLGQATFYSYGIMPETLEPVGICSDPKQEKVQAGEAKIALVALADREGRGLFSIRGQVESPLDFKNQACLSSVSETVFCPHSDCDKVKSFFYTTLTALKTRQVISTGLMVAERKSCRSSP